MKARIDADQVFQASSFERSMDIDRQFMTRHPTLDDQLKEQANFVGPRQPPRAPKFIPKSDVRAVEDMLRRDFIRQLETEAELYELGVGAQRSTSGSGTKS